MGVPAEAVISIILSLNDDVVILLITTCPSAVLCRVVNDWQA